MLGLGGAAVIGVGFHPKDAQGRKQAGVECAFACGVLGVTGVNTFGDADVDAATGAFEEVEVSIQKIQIRRDAS